jgi:hypothetical protein
MAKNTDQTPIVEQEFFFGSAGLAKVIGKAVFILRRPLEKFLEISSPGFQSTKPNIRGFHFLKQKQNVGSLCSSEFACRCR